MVREREGARRRDRLTLVAGLAEEGEALLGELLRLLEVSFLDGGHTEHVEVESGATRVTKAAVQLERLCSQRPGRRHVSASVREERCSGEGPGARCCRTLLALKRAFETTSPFVDVPALVPEHRQGSSELQDQLVLA